MAPELPPHVRAARMGDIDDLLRIEEAVFPGDRLTRRNFRHAVASPSIVSLVVERDGRVAGYVLAETRRTARVARLSSIAVSPGGSGDGRRLAEAVETVLGERGCDRLRLEVRADNRHAIRFYGAAGYRRIGRVARYYEDGAAALRFEKTLGPDAPAGRTR